jgi:hypothetical protein
VVTSHSSPSPTPRPHQKQKPARQHCITGRRRVGLYASGWRDGFKAGAVDALRLAGRRLPVEAWNILDDLADAYELAGE